MTSNIQNPTKEWIIVSAVYSLTWRRNCWGKRKPSTHTKQERRVIIHQGFIPRLLFPENNESSDVVCVSGSHGRFCGDYGGLKD